MAVREAQRWIRGRTAGIVLGVGNARIPAEEVSDLVLGLGKPLSVRTGEGERTRLPRIGDVGLQNMPANLPGNQGSGTEGLYSIAACCASSDFDCS